MACLIEYFYRSRWNTAVTVLDKLIFYPDLIKMSSLKYSQSVNQLWNKPSMMLFDENSLALWLQY